MSERPAPREFRHVTIQELLPFARKGCSRCVGLGYFLRLESGQEKRHAACGCAVRRWLKAHAGRFAWDSKKNLKVLVEPQSGDAK